MSSDADIGLCILQVAVCRSRVEVRYSQWRAAGDQLLAERAVAQPASAAGEAVAQGGPAACSWVLTSTKWFRSSPLYLGPGLQNAQSCHPIQ